MSPSLPFIHLTALNPCISEEIINSYCSSFVSIEDVDTDPTLNYNFNSDISSSPSTFTIPPFSSLPVQLQHHPFPNAYKKVSSWIDDTNYDDEADLTSSVNSLSLYLLVFINNNSFPPYECSASSQYSFLDRIFSVFESLSSSSSSPPSPSLISLLKYGIIINDIFKHLYNIINQRKLRRNKRKEEEEEIKRRASDRKEQNSLRKARKNVIESYLYDEEWDNEQEENDKKIGEEEENYFKSEELKDEKIDFLSNNDQDIDLIKFFSQIYKTLNSPSINTSTELNGSIPTFNSYLTGLSTAFQSYSSSLSHPHLLFPLQIHLSSAKPPVRLSPSVLLLSSAKDSNDEKLLYLLIYCIVFFFLGLLPEKR
jgi:hypothetical protein